MEKIPVLFIAGAGRSGSTLLERMLGQTADLSPIGELRHLGRQDFELDLCGCGQRFQECPFWAAVFAEALWQSSEFS
ncbi:MAG: sulfotransferase [Chloroflexi bacterium]|nr:sulfotransferase [Chloroflexota bacterium]